MTQKGFAVFNYDEKPLVKVTFTGETVTDENFEIYMKDSHRVFEYERYALLYDISKLGYLPAKYRILQGKDLEQTKEKIAKQAIGLAIVAPSFITRMIVEGVFLVKPYPSHYKICASEEEARQWIAERLKVEKVEQAI